MLWECPQSNNDWVWVWTNPQSSACSNYSHSTSKHDPRHWGIKWVWRIAISKESGHHIRVIKLKESGEAGMLSTILCGDDKLKLFTVSCYNCYMTATLLWWGSWMLCNAWVFQTFENCFPWLLRSISALQLWSLVSSSEHISLWIWIEIHTPSEATWGMSSFFNEVWHHL